MDDPNQLTTVQIDVQHREMLRELAKLNKRSMFQHLCWMVLRDFQDIEEQRVSITAEGRAALQDENEKAPAGETASA